MAQINIPFQAIDWSHIEKTEHKGETGTSWWQTQQFGGLRIRIVEYSPGYLADHWCRKGHIVHCLQGHFTSELQSGERIELREGGTYVVSDELSSHRSVSEDGVRLLIIDGDFLQRQGAGLLPDHLETGRLRLDILRIDDSTFIRGLVNSEGWLHFIGDRKVHSEEDAVRYIQGMLGNANATIHVVRLRESGIPVGITTLIRRPWLEHPDIGFALLPEHEGKGYSYESSKALLDRLAQNGVLPEVFAITLPDNHRSIRLLERLGLRNDGPRTVEGENLLLFRKPLARS
ncbi:N-acetyltransferase [Flaviaesturariibacter flavus]|uniref:N-acetyltransferase n=1 Tax=Flaviaesturariibacter flavus TaxID=2502780 RepID=A0A4R1B505_9BACT|nr:DHCW motif cupin fold protein [Flaviaesturariibacter flavus]TCJ12560.1 N-acetyltransferase [Flaviaesturariibacter flavus]